MGKKDIVTKAYMDDEERFADAFNYLLFSGEQVIRAGSLKELDVNEIGIVFANDSVEVTQKVRDLLKQSIIKYDKKYTYLLLGLENQSEIHYAMPVKNMIYDSLNYGDQVAAISKKHREKKDLKGAEFLSGFHKTDKLKPIITVTIYWGDEYWDAPRSLFDMFENSEGIRDYVNDYKLNLIVPKEIKDFNRFSTELGKILKFIAVSDDEEEMRKIQFDKSFKTISNEAVNLLNICTGSDINLEEEGEKESMCKGIDDMKRTERSRGKEETTIKIVQNMLKSGKYSDEEIMTITNITHDKLEQCKRRELIVGENRVMENQRLKVTVNDVGAELYSIYDKENEREIIWPAEPIYWKRHAPILFPNVGKTYPGTFRYNGKTYPTKQHGFARDMEFDFVDGTENVITHLLTSDEKTIEEYPFEFGLKVIHELSDNELHIRWIVENTGDGPMYFTIGGHPAFQVPADNWKNEDVRIDRQENYYLTFEKDQKELEYVLLDAESGTAKVEETKKLVLEDGRCLIGTDRFKNDALIFDNTQIEKAGIAFPDGTPYITMECKGFPNFGIWQAPEAPFICLEPWWGRCDNHGFDGTLDQKPGIIKVEAGKTFEASYKIVVE